MNRRHVFALALALALILASGSSPGLAEEGRNTQAPLGDSAPSPTSAAMRMAAWRQHERMRLESPFRNLTWQAVGPRMQGGRVEAIEVDPNDDATMYVGAGSGNLWKTVNAGVTWRPIFEREATFTIGDVTAAPSNPDVVWVGTGEVLMARSSYAGTGVYRSVDGGDSWSHLGLEDTHHIARVLVHPEDPDKAWVAAVGHLYSFNEQRGVFRTEDGGTTWERTLYVNDRTGAIDLVADPRDSDVLYAAMWERSRRVWGHTTAGSGSGVYKSIDGGRSWRRLAGGFPAHEHVGRVALAIAPTRPDTIYALIDDDSPVERDENGDRPPRGHVFRSDDAGDTWREVTERPIPAGYDFCLIQVAVDDADKVYVPGQVVWLSEDGGRTFAELGGRVVHLLDHDATVRHLDQHEMWRDPRDPDHLIVGNDGGVYVTHDAGANWLHLNNLPIAEFYAVDVDMQVPYNIWGGTQDDAALRGPSNAELTDGTEDPWQHVYLDRWGGGDSYFTMPHPLEPWTVFYEHQFGALRRKDLRDGTTVDVQPRAPEGEEPYRFNWMGPFLTSAYDPDTLYFGTQFMMRSRDRGDTWEAISPDLTTDPGPERQGNVPYGTLTTIAESPLRSEVLWAGSDDGRVHVTSDGGAAWSDVTGDFEGLWVSRVVASRFHPDRAYVTLTGYREDDTGARVFATDDLGENWRSLAAGLPAEAVNVIDEDPESQDILYVGTDLGVYVSLDRGETWHSLVGDLPTTPVHDLVAHPRDGELVIGTHGRGAFVLDIKPIRRTTPETLQAPLHLYEILPAVASRRDGTPGRYRLGTTSSEARFTYSLAAPGAVTVTILDGAGEPLRTLRAEGATGLNVLAWDLLAEGARLPQGSFDPYPQRVPAGSYVVLVEVAGATVQSTLTVLAP